MRRLFTGIAAIGIVAAPLTVAAQSASTKSAQVRKLRLYKEKLGHCVIDGGGAPLARGLITRAIDRRETWHDSHRLVLWECPASALGSSSLWKKIDGADFLFMIAPILVRSDFPSKRNFDFASVPALAHLDPSQDAEDQRIAALSRFGECVSRAAPLAVHELLLTRVTSPAENEALAALSPTLNSCVAGGQIRFDRDSLRGVLALNFYRLAGVPKGKRIDMPKLDS